MEIKIIRPGMLTTVQDLGRRGYRHCGLSSGGAMDAHALRLANLLVGNRGHEAALEMTLVGAELEFSADALIAVTGADMGALDMRRPQMVKAGDRLKFTAAQNGARTYLAVAGGLRIELMLGGRGTDLRAGLGGHEGRALQAGDVLSSNKVNRQLRGHWQLGHGIIPDYSEQPVVRVIGGSQVGEFEPGFFETSFEISTQSDRMGLRLNGEKLMRKSKQEMISSAVAPGTIQVPTEGEPIVLMADAQTIGGYPRIAHAIQADLPLLAQLRPGNGVSFRLIELAEAHRLWLEQEKTWGLLRQGLRDKFR